MWYVVSGRTNPSQETYDSEAIWTVSQNPDEPGWETDGGFEGYGLLYATAKFLADAANEKLSDVRTSCWRPKETMPTEAGSRFIVSKSPLDMTIAELQAEIGMLQSILHRKVCGDPRECVTVAVSPQWPFGGGETL